MARVLVVAGEASGDALLAPVAARLKARGHRVLGIGGDACAAAGVELFAHARDLAAHGLVEAVGAVPAFLRALRAARRALSSVDVALLVDFPEMNRRLLDAASAPVAWLAPPQAWAWRPWRAAALRRAAWVGCLFEFGAEWYRAQGIAAEWVGHPLAEGPAPPAAVAPAVALLPGSRDSAVRALLPVMLAATRRLGLPAWLAVAPTVDRAWPTRAARASGLPIRFAPDAAAALAESSLALVGAGTVTLEAALAGRPCVTLARMHPVSAAVGRRLLNTSAISLPNLILGAPVLPERVQRRCTAVAVAEAARGLMGAPPTAELAALRRRCPRPDLAGRVVAAVEGLLRARR